MIRHISVDCRFIAELIQGINIFFFISMNNYIKTKLDMRGEAIQTTHFPSL